MYYIIRMIVVLILYVGFTFYQKKKGVLVWQRTAKTVIIRGVVAAVILAIVFIPYESSFIRFDSAEASVRYRTINYNAPIKTVETDKTAFCIGHRDNNFYYNTVTKYGDQYGFCDRNCQTLFGLDNITIDDGVFYGAYSVHKMVDNETNEKCYIIKFYGSDQEDAENISIYDEQNRPAETITFSDNRTVYAIVVKDIDEKASFVLNGNTYELN